MNLKSISIVRLVIPFAYAFFLLLPFCETSYSQNLKTKSHPFPSSVDKEKIISKQLRIVIGNSKTNTSNALTQHAPTVLGLYVNDNSTTGDVFTTAVGNDANPGTATAPFATISYAISQASNGTNIYVDAGTYAENIDVTKAVNLRGANYNTTFATRNAESIIYPATSDPDPFSPNGVVIMYLEAAASGGSVSGFTIDGDNPNLTGGVINNGADVDAVEAIGAYDGIGSVTIKNNIIKNTNYAGIDFYTNSAVPTTGNLVDLNKFDNIMPSQFGIGVIIYNNCYTSITNNIMTAVRVGIQTGNFEQADPGNSHTIQANNIESSRRAIWHNLAYSNAANFQILNNTVTTYASSTNNDGIMISSLQSNVGVTVSGNNVSGANNGYQLWNCPTSNTVTVTGGTVSNCHIGVFANNYDGYVSNADASSYIIDGVSISGGDTAIYIRDNILNTNSTTVSVQIKNSTTISGSTAGIRIEGGDASLSFNGATPASFSSVSYYIDEVSNTANPPATDIDATAVNFEGNIGSSMSAVDLFTTEDKITHKMDNTSLGFVTVKGNNDFVTTNSGTIQRGIDLASTGWTVNVNTGNYNENVNVNKVLTLQGSGNDVSGTVISGTGVIATLIPGTSSSTRVVIKNLRISGGTTGITVSSYTTLEDVVSTGNSSYGISLSSLTDLVLNGCSFINNQVGLKIASTISVSSITIDNCHFDNNSI